MRKIVGFTYQNKSIPVVGHYNIKVFKIISIKSLLALPNIVYIHILSPKKSKALGIRQKLYYRQSFTIIFLAGECPVQPT
jgi:hypothetical protein